MKLIFLLIYTPFVFTELHTFTTTYTGVKGIERIPEFFAITTLDGQQLDYYDSITQKLIPKQKWLEEHVYTDMWEGDIQIRHGVQAVYQSNIHVLMSRFNQTRDIHTYQRMYGCSWDSETEKSDEFDEYGYDGEDFIMLDLKEARYITSLPQGVRTMNKWNENRGQIEFLLNFYKYECAYWIKHFISLRKDALKSTAPEVSLLQTSIESNVWCHVTGFYPAGVRIYWLKNGQEHDEDIYLTETLPNEDGTFQKTVMLSVRPEEWKKNQYICVVEHISLMEKIQKIVNEDEIKSNDRPVKVYLITLCVMMVVMLMMFLNIILVVLFLKKQDLGPHKKLDIHLQKDTCMQTSNYEVFDKDA